MLPAVPVEMLIYQYLYSLPISLSKTLLFSLNFISLIFINLLLLLLKGTTTWIQFFSLRFAAYLFEQFPIKFSCPALRTGDSSHSQPLPMSPFDIFLKISYTTLNFKVHALCTTQERNRRKQEDNFPCIFSMLCLLAETRFYLQ